MPAKFYLPINLDLQNKKCLVVGGGKIAKRKIHNLLSAGAKVLVVAKAASVDCRNLAKKNKIKLLIRPFLISDLNTAFLVIAATSDKKINQRIAWACRKKRILVNVVDAPAISDFISPAFFRRGNLVISVSTGGKNPALAKIVKASLKKYHAYARS